MSITNIRAGLRLWSIWRWACLWLAVLFYLIISPQLKFHQLQAARSSIMRAMAEKRESAVITLIHRQESLGLFGIPFYRFIDIEDSEQVLRAIRMVPKGKPIELIEFPAKKLLPNAFQCLENQIGMAGNSGITGF